jgi:uncharacterized membrane protein YhaH (DUF805 family)
MQGRHPFTDMKPRRGTVPRTHGLWTDMGGASSQFGRRGVGAALKAPRVGPASPSASMALQAATQWNRPGKEPSLKDLVPLDRDDGWAMPTSSLALGGAAAIERPSPMTMLFSSRGRVRRRDYWTFNIASSTSAILAILIAAASLPALQALLVAVPVAMVSVRIRSCLRIKRWHDRGKSAVWVLIGLVPFVGWAWSFMECGLMEGTPGPNIYGPSPK